MTEAVMEFFKEYLPKTIEGGFAIGVYVGAISALTGYVIKQAIGFFDK